MSKEKQKYYLTRITIDVLSDKPIDENMSLSDIASECDSGDFVGQQNDVFRNKQIGGKQAVSRLEKAGSTGDFFGLNEKGRPLRDY
jgi:hypothetical protein